MRLTSATARATVGFGTTGILERNPQMTSDQHAAQVAAVRASLQLAPVRADRQFEAAKPRGGKS